MEKIKPARIIMLDNGKILYLPAMTVDAADACVSLHGPICVCKHIQLDHRIGICTFPGCACLKYIEAECDA